MNRLLATLVTLVATLLIVHDSAGAQNLSNPILFVTQVPTPNDSATVTSLFANNVADMQGAPRGGDLWIRYPDGSLKNLTLTAGYGVNGQQGAGAIAVREPSVHWSGTKALFSMVVGGAAFQGDTAAFYWQIYEITGLGKNETPVITRIATQPAGYNNVSPIYGTDDRIIYTSDRPPTGGRYLYPFTDEYKGAPTNTGLWSLDPATGDLLLLDHSPSGDFSPTMDSYGRLLVMRWDRLQRDRNADIDVLGPGAKGTFNYTDESATGTPQFNVRPESFPEPQGGRPDLLNGTNMLGFEFNQFFPWQINEDGTSPETINHLGRHEMRQVFNRAINDDPNVVQFNFANTPRSNRNPVNNFMQAKEDPNTPGLYYGTDGFQTGTHSGGQILSLTAAPTLDPDQSVVTYLTDRSTASITFEGNTPNPNHSGFYRNPVMLAGGTLIAAHSTDSHADKNLGSRSNPVSRYAYRLKTLKKVGPAWVPDVTLTAGISKSVTYWDTDTLVHYSGTLWELDPVEVRARTKPARRQWSLPSVEHDVFVEEGISETAFRGYLREKDLAVAVSRDVTHRDGADKQQPFYLRIAGTTKQSANPTGKIYDVSHLQLYQGDYVRGHGLMTPNGTPAPGRRILPVPMHLPAGTNPTLNGAPAGSVKLGADGSLAAFVPAHRAMTWQLTSPTGTPVVRERYWVTFQPGEIRVCASCHGTNDGAPAPLNPIPANKPAALRDLLRSWKAQTFPLRTSLISPANDSAGIGLQGAVTWLPENRSASYRVQISATQDFAAPLVDRDSLATATTAFSGLEHNTPYYWRVRGNNKYGTGDWSDVWRFTTVVDAPSLTLPANAATARPLNDVLRWKPVPGADLYHVQLSTAADFGSTLIDRMDVTDTLLNAANLDPTKTYYWRVGAVGHGAAGAWSEVWSFTTGAAPSISAPLLHMPQNGTASIPVAGTTLRWLRVPGADTYSVRVSTASDFATTIADRSGLTDTASDLSGLEHGKRYYWQARASGAAGESPWSETWSFTAESLPGLAAPLLLSPPDGASSVSQAGMLRWRYVSGAEGYRVRVARSQDFAAPVVDRTGVPDTTLEVSGLEESTRYYWQAGASGPAGLGPWSDIWSFTTAKAAASVGASELGAGVGLALAQNRPDPFTEGTTISFRVPRAGWASLRLFDVQGRLAASLVDAEIDAGEHAFVLDAGTPGFSDLSAGVYVVQLHTTDGLRAILLHLAR